jgi:hypothetical protein
MSEFEKGCRYEEWAHEVYQIPFLEEKGWELLERREPFDHRGDYRVRLADGRERDVEFKAERKYRGNLAFEHWSDKGKNPGWITNSKADVLIYLLGGDTDSPLNIIMKMPQAVAWFAEHGQKSRYNQYLKEPFANANQNNQTVFYAYPINVLSNQGLWMKKFTLEPKGIGPS